MATMGMKGLLEDYFMILMGIGYGVLHITANSAIA